MKVDIQFPAPRSLQFVTEKNVIVAGVVSVLSLFIRGPGTGDMTARRGSHRGVVTRDYDDPSVVGGGGPAQFVWTESWKNDTTTQPQTAIMDWGEGGGWQARTGDWWSIRCPQPGQRCSTLGIVINYTRNVSSQPWSLVSSKLSDWWVNLAILITYQSWNISSQQQHILLLSAEILILTPAAGRDNIFNHRPLIIDIWHKFVDYWPNRKMV